MEKQKKIIAVILDYAQPQLVEGVREYCRENGLDVDARWSVRGDWVIPNEDWDGVIYRIVDWDRQDLRDEISAWDFCRVEADSGDSEHSVEPDYFLAGELAAEELANYGAREILCAAYSNHPVDLRFAEGAAAWADRLKIPCRLLCIDKTLTFEKMLDRFIVEIGKMGSGAGFCISQASFSHSLQKRLLKIGKRIPGDVAMVTLDKDLQNTAAHAPVPISAVEQGSWLLGYVAAEMLHMQMKGEDVPAKKVRIPPKGIIRRDSTGCATNQDPAMAKALAFVRKNFQKQIGVEDVAKAAGFSRRVMETRFRQVLSRGVHEEITRLRIERAKDMLSNGKSKISEIADECGFSSLHYFSTAFKREAGTSPRNYRNLG